MKSDKRLACVMGWPLGHSRSPIIHNYWIKKHGLNAEYTREPVKPEDFAGFIASFRERGYVGGNCTIPHKEQALKLSVPDERARAVGAANCLWFEGDKLRSTNTDVEGFLKNLDMEAPGWDRGLTSAVVLGAGGGARAVVYGLISREVERIYVVNRTIARAEAFKAQFGSRVHPVGWNEVGGLVGGAGVLVNATSLGMAGQPELDINLRGQASLVVADLVYLPLETPLLRLARERGLRTADGLGMLLHQAVRGFELWFGVKPEVTKELRDLVVADLNKK